MGGPGRDAASHHLAYLFTLLLLGFFFAFVFTCCSLLLMILIHVFMLT